MFYDSVLSPKTDMLFLCSAFKLSLELGIQWIRGRTNINAQGVPIFVPSPTLHDAFSGGWARYEALILLNFR